NYKANPRVTETNVTDFTDSFSDSSNHNSFAYPTTITDGDLYSSYIQYNFDYGLKTQVQTPPPNQNLPAPIQTFAYDDALRIQRVTSLTNNSYKRYVYGPDSAYSFSSVNNVADENYVVQGFDGLGRVTAT